MSSNRTLPALAAAATLSLLAVPNAAGEPMLRLTLLLRNEAAVPADDPSRRCVSSWARATPYQRVIRRRDLEASGVTLVARVEMRDGRRAVLSSLLRRC